ncbi:MAG TPA: Wzz/FepE/Etk N-terminal domain-containing protein [Chloroflexota bacterium]|nr:Wzz/FepE/Etk N-terminal domain-containing protein [Chloroflexota bacterium]HZU07152.1 Wzz/FepE/Etk N-terminal domain-containing protein [Chloroflexota bacterium]
MELAEYLAIVRRRWWLVALTTLAALLVAGLLAYRGASAYKATVRLAVSVPVSEDCMGRTLSSPDGASTRLLAYDCNYYAWLSSEYLADDLSEVVRSRAFAEDVSAVLGEDIDPKSISDVVRTRKTHRILSITVTANEFARAQRIGEAIVEVLRTQPGKYLAQLATDTGRVVVIDPPQTQRGDGPVAVALDIGVKTLLGLLFGLALVFALDYFDPTVRDARDVERTLGLPVLGEIPAEAALARQPAPVQAPAGGVAVPSG